MTKKYLALALGAIMTGFLFVACDKDNPEETNQSQEPTINFFDGNGASKALFSVGENKQVRFSRGNLQYQASSGSWRFAEQQYSYIGEANTNISETYDGWIDLFGWGTSGWESGANAYQPWSTSVEHTDYYPGGSMNNNLKDDYAEADWAWHNTIENGGRQAHLWRMMTEEEWHYLLGGRPDAAEKRGVATVGDVYGKIILPDEWVLPEGLTFTSGRDNGWETNRYTLQEWGKMELAGAIFLPAARSREGVIYLQGNPHGGDYWTASKHDSYSSVAVVFSADMLSVGWVARYTGASVRPVMDDNQ